MGWESVTLNSSLSALTVDKFRLEDETFTFDRLVDRTPLSDTWWEYGTKTRTAQLRMSVRPTYEDEEAAHEQIGAVLARLPTLSSLGWNGRTRTLYGVTGGVTMQPSEFGHIISFTAACRAGDWTGNSGTAQDDPQGIVINSASDSISVFADYPTESLDFQRRIEVNESGGLVEMGDLKWNPSTLTIKYRLRGTTPGNVLAAAIKLLTVASSVTTLSIGSRSIDVFGLRSATRKYNKPLQISGELTFLPREILHPLTAGFLLFEDLDFMQFEDTDLIKLG